MARAVYLVLQRPVKAEHIAQKAGVDCEENGRAGRGWNGCPRIVTEDRFHADRQQPELDHHSGGDEDKDGGEKCCSLFLRAHAVTSTPVAKSWPARFSSTILGSERVGGPAVGRPALSSNTPLWQ